MQFSDFHLHADLLQAVLDLGFTTPTPIQEAAIPEALQGKDLLASAQTGTGKTAAYLLPSLHRLKTGTPTHARGPRMLILAPTRELAMQIAADAVKLGKHLRQHRTVCVYGGASFVLQNRQLSKPYDVLIATPGRLIDHMERGRISLANVEILVLDEGDRLLDMGFIQPVEKIASACRKDRQTLLFSATFSKNVRQLSQNLQRQPLEIHMAHAKAEASHIEQRLHRVDDLEHKYKMLEHLMKDPELKQAIVFTATKSHTTRIKYRLEAQGLEADVLHGDMNQRCRTRTMMKMRNGEIQILVATDVAARGIDIKAITHVINFDLPFNSEDYVHRIGRTGRAGASGVAFVFATPNELATVQRIERETGNKLADHVVPGLEPQKQAFAARRPRNDSNRSFNRKKRFPSKRSRHPSA